MKKSYGVAISAMLLLALAPAAQAGAVLDAITPWNGSSAIATWGATFTPNYGQTFIAPSDNAFLTGVEIEMENIQNSDHIFVTLDFQEHLVAWDGSAPTGPDLWTSGVLTLSGGSWQDVAQTPKIQLVDGNQYLLYATALSAQAPTHTQWGNANGDFFPGAFCFQNISASWSCNFEGPGFEAADKFTFAADQSGGGGGDAPEPATFAMIAGGLAVLGSFKKRSS
jgi:hypothetical protein